MGSQSNNRQITNNDFANEKKNLTSNEIKPKKKKSKYRKHVLHKRFDSRTANTRSLHIIFNSIS